MCAAFKILSSSNILFVFRVLMLRQKASPTETDLRVEYSHMVDAAVEVIRLESRPNKTPESLVQFTSTDAQPQP